VTSPVAQYTTRLLTPGTWDDFAALVEANNGVWGRCVGWCQYGPPAEVASIKNPRAHERGLAGLPDWRIGCLFTGSGSRREGVARAGVAAIAHAGGGLVEAHPEQWLDVTRNVAPTCSARKYRAGAPPIDRAVSA
jgi:hypothetical protein